MNPETAQALLAINRAFYDECAEAFAATRTRPWTGFQRILPADGRALTVLDVGCGNGRFAHTALATGHAQGAPRVASYVGLDASEPLLQLARSQPLPFPAEFRQYDILAPLSALPQCSLIVVFGVMHHIPGKAQRHALVESLCQQLSPGGRLVLSFFRYERSPRIMRRLARPAMVEAQHLEPGDFLLPFGDTGGVRYCHRFEEDELLEMAQRSGLRTVARFTPEQGSDVLNDYLVLEAD